MADVVDVVEDTLLFRDVLGRRRREPDLAARGPATVLPSTEESIEPIEDLPPVVNRIRRSSFASSWIPSSLEAEAMLLWRSSKLAEGKKSNEDGFEDGLASA